MLKKKIKFWLVVTGSILVFTSCSLALKASLKKSIVKEIKVLEKNDKKIVFFPVSHIGYNSYFESIKKEMDSLHNEGFAVFFEGVQYSDSINAIRKDTLQRKVRRIMGYHLSSSYKDSTNQSLPKYMSKNKLIMQTIENTGLKKGDRLVDMTIDSLITLYEIDFGKIKLNDCDFNTPLLEKFKCKDLQKHSRLAFLKTYRNINLVKEVLKETNTKIAIIYGSGHWYDLSRRFYTKGFKLTKGK